MEPVEVASRVPLVEPSESEFALLDHAPLATCVYAPDGYCVYANAAWERLWKLPRAVAMRHNILEDPLLNERGLLPLLRRAFAGESVQLPVAEYHPAGRGQTGRSRSIRTHLAPFNSTRGGRYVVTRMEDVTDAVGEGLTHAAILDALSQMGIAIALLEGGRITWANDAYERMTGYCLAELTSPDFDALTMFPGESKPAQDKRMAERTAGLRVDEHLEREIRRKDGTTLAVEITARTTQRGPPPRIVTILRVVPA